MIFVGNEKAGYFVTEVAKELSIPMEYVDEASYIETQVNRIMNCKSEDFIVYDIAQYINEANQIAEQIYRIQRAKNAKVIIYAPGFVPKSNAIKALYQKGITNFVFPVIPSKIKEDLQKCINGYFDVNPIEELNEIKEETQEVEKNDKNIKSIALVGACSRIGTTTQAFQIIKYLQLIGYNACYIEMNNRGYVNLINECYEGTEFDDDLEKVTYMNIDMFYNMNRINEYLTLNYDFYVYDYGVFDAIDFNRVSFLEKEVRVVVAGIKANEIIATNAIFTGQFYRDVQFIFSFVADSEKKDVYELMEEKADQTFFAEYTPDMFTLKNYETYEKMLNVEIKEDPKQNRRSLFSKFKRKK